MSLALFQEQIENEREWREAEIRFLHNNQNKLEKDKDKQLIRRSILCLVYAHVEGFVSFAFSLYIDEINKKKLLCKDVKPAIAAASFHKVFKAFTNTDKKNVIFKQKLPDDKHLHRLAREINFLESVNEFNSHLVIIPDDFINTENNVGMEVLEKLLFKVGLDHDDLKSIYRPLTKLLNVRNDISHGKRKLGIDDKNYEEFLNCGKSVISTISSRLTTAYGTNKFLLVTA
jgi:hypothetical protein